MIEECVECRRMFYKGSNKRSFKTKLPITKKTKEVDNEKLSLLKLTFEIGSTAQTIMYGDAIADDEFGGSLKHQAHLELDC